MSIPTPHIEATDEYAFGQTVLMPGDPLRSKFIAENFLTDPVLVNNVRGVQGYTGTWKGVRVSTMATGMGMPAVGIYTTELFTLYHVKNIIRVGSAGALQDDLHLMDIVAGQAACTDSNFSSVYAPAGCTFAPIADFTLLSAAVEAGKARGINIRVGNLSSSDHFYYPEGAGTAVEWKKLGVLAAEMESAALYTTAAYTGNRALCLCTISDHIFHPEENMSAAERQTGFANMIEIALDTAVAMENK